jgi:hypothetical protein
LHSLSLLEEQGEVIALAGNIRGGGFFGEMVDEKNALSRSSTSGTIPATVETSPLFYR